MRFQTDRQTRHIIIRPIRKPDQSPTGNAQQPRRYMSTSETHQPAPLAAHFALTTPRLLIQVAPL